MEILKDENRNLKAQISSNQQSEQLKCEDVKELKNRYIYMYIRTYAIHYVI